MHRNSVPLHAPRCCSWSMALFDKSDRSPKADRTTMEREWAEVDASCLHTLRTVLQHAPCVLQHSGAGEAREAGARAHAVAPVPSSEELWPERSRVLPFHGGALTRFRRVVSRESDCVEPSLLVLQSCRSSTWRTSR